MMNPEYAKANALIGSPHLPRLHLAWGKGSPRMRLSSTQPMDIMYVESKARSERETIMLKAKLDPKLMRQRSVVRKEVR
jgi:hypothetical protein